MIKKYLLDTNIIIDHLNGMEYTRKKLSALIENLEELNYCIINLIEVYTGINENSRDKTDLFFSHLTYIELTKEIGFETSNYLKKYNKLLKIGDAIIASVSKIDKLILITNNKKHFPMNDFEIISLK